MREFTDSELFYLLIAGVVALAAWYLVRRGRLQEEASSVLERLLLACWILLLSTCLLILTCRSDVLTKPTTDDDEPRELQTYSREGSGCSSPKKRLRDFNDQ